LLEIADALFDQPATGFSAWIRTTAGIVVMLLGLQVVTGLLLAFYFVPSADAAHATVSYIEKVVPAGSWIRAIHHYGSQWLTLFLVLHLAQMFWRASYRRRPVAWVAGVFMLALILAGGATGYSLPWDARAFFGTRVAEGIVGGLPLIGEAARRWLLGGVEISTLTLSRFFALHVLITPALILLVVVARLFVFRDGEPLADHSWNTSKTRQLTRQVVAAGVVFLAIALYAVKYPAPLGPAASEASMGYLPRPGAQFLWLFQMLKYLPGRAASTVAALLPGLIFAGLALLPFLDSRRQRKTSTLPRRRLSFALIAIGLGFFTLMTALAYMNDARDTNAREQLARQAAEESAFRSEPFKAQRIGEPAPAPVASNVSEKQPLSPDHPPAAYLKKCANCHGKQGQGVKPFPNLLGVAEKPRRTVDDIVGLLDDPVAYGLEPPMKSFATKLTDQEKREIAAWVVILKKR
jgi:ubiquinol-cytochrome c reductase cytochrome b subunit